MTNPVEDNDLTGVEENSKLIGSSCETSENALLCLASDDSNDGDWLPARMAKKRKRKTNDSTRKFLSLDDDAHH
jgi:hypothetical protein